MNAVVTMRLRQMRKSAAWDGKACPSADVLETLAAGIIADGMKCPHCRRVMNWRNAEGRSTVVSLQHDHNGGFRLICFACNVRHQFYPGDEFYAVKAGHKRCTVCGKDKPRSEFYPATSDGRVTAKCRECERAASLARYHAKKRSTPCA